MGRGGDCGHVPEVVLEECAPGLRGWIELRWAVPPSRGVADLNADLSQLGPLTRLAPCWIRVPHVADQLLDLGIDSRAAALGPAPSTPIGAQSLSVPLHDGSRLNEDEDSVPTGPGATQPDPEEPVAVLEPKPHGLPLEHHQRMPKRDVIDPEIPLTLQRGNETPSHDTHPIPRRRLLSLNRETSVISPQMRFSPATVH